MVPEVLNYTIFRGVTFGPEVITCRDSAGTAINITNYTAYAEAREVPCGSLVLNLAPTVSNGATGQVTLSHSNGNTSNFTLGRYGWDLILKAPNGVRSGPYAAGRLAISDLHSQPV